MSGHVQKTSASRMRVFLRVRPANSVEKERGDHQRMLECSETQVTVHHPQRRSETFDFERVFYPHTQEHVFETVAKESCAEAMSGFHSLLFAYGMTGCGKTFTLCNDQPGNEGVLHRSLNHCFDLMNQDTDNEYTLTITMVQIYCEMVTDLLNPNTSNNNVTLRDDPQVRDAVLMKNCSIVPVKTFDEAWETFLKGDKARAVGDTAMNEKSSRSHTVFTLYIQKRQVMSEEDYGPKGGQKDVINGRLTIVDLAGCERVSKTGATGERLDEAKMINKSLLALGRVVHILTNDQQGQHIPFRESKLTRLLQYSMSGRGKTAIVINCGPSASHYDETLSAIQFGQRARKIQVRAEVHKTVDWKALALKYEAMLTEGTEGAVREALDLQRKEFEKKGITPGTEAPRIRELEEQNTKLLLEKQNLQQQLSAIQAKYVTRCAELEEVLRGVEDERQNLRSQLQAANRARVAAGGQPISMGGYGEMGSEERRELEETIEDLRNAVVMRDRALLQVKLWMEKNGIQPNRLVLQSGEGEPLDVDGSQPYNVLAAQNAQLRQELSAELEYHIKSVHAIRRLVGEKAQLQADLDKLRGKK